MNTSTSAKLYFLLALFIAGFLSLFFLNQFFTTLVSDLDQKTLNNENKIKIGKYVAEDILELESLFYTLATTTTSKKTRTIVNEKLINILKKIHLSLDTLEKGGSLTRTIKLNIAGHTTSKKIITYIPNKLNEISLEAIDIRPKLFEFKNMIKEANQLLDMRNHAKKTKYTKTFLISAKKIRRYYKTTPAFFTRMRENIQRLLYEGDIELNNLKQEISNKKMKYLNMKMILILFVIIIALGLGYWIIKIVNTEESELITLNKDLQKKELAVKAILDGQDNMVIVSDGIKMIDANSAISDFFSQFDTLEDFTREHECICDLFEEDIPNDSYLIKKDYDGLNWLEYTLANSNKAFNVILNNGTENHHFKLSAKKRILDESNFIIIVSLNDITSEITSQSKLKNLNDNLELIVENKTRELQDLNENLEQKILIETQKVRDKDKQMTQQARFAAMGEMIGNIAHQWRQPLSAINTTASGMQLQVELGITSNDEVKESYQKIMGYVDFLTQTIEDFRGFFKEDKEKIEFNIIDSISNTISITNATYKNENIILLNTCNDTDSFLSLGMPSELSQVILNVLNNARDALTSNNLEEKYVSISCIQEDGCNAIYIQDNAGGIPTKIIDKIFDPYFTTKHQSQGTGIGLYMSKDIIEKHMNGLLTVQNKAVTFNKHDYNGACFRISLPIFNT